MTYQETALKAKSFEEFCTVMVVQPSKSLRTLFNDIRRGK